MARKKMMIRLKIEAHSLEAVLDVRDNRSELEMLRLKRGRPKMERGISGTFEPTKIVISLTVSISLMALTLALQLITSPCFSN